MKWFGGLVVGLWVVSQLLGLNRFPSDDRGEVPASVRQAPGGLLMWHDGFMGGK
ncbi:MAG: hypothetical protein INH41_12650 [Myxococcaceae bacterium]|jgi:hypothetical protein|nr:hypothetical protein [Myxococcaceae bacterium]